jgi:hypothetical protein
MKTNTTDRFAKAPRLLAFANEPEWLVPILTHFNLSLAADAQTWTTTVTIGKCLRLPDT